MIKYAFVNKLMNICFYKTQLYIKYINKNVPK